MRDAHERAARWVRPEIQAMAGYTVADPSPWPWPGDLEQAWLERLRGETINRYPDPEARALKAQLREALGVPEGASLILGNGSDELIQLIDLAVAGAGRTVLAPAPSFAMYRVIAELTGAQHAELPLGPDFGLDGAALSDALARHRPAVTFLAHPNNPTGNGLDLAAVAAAADQAEGLVVVDEAYAPYAESTFLPEVLSRPNVLVLRTLSKVGLAGLRLGILIGHPAWVEQLEKGRLPYNLGRLAQTSAAFALEHPEALDRAVAQVLAERRRLARALTGVSGVEAVFPTQTNFVTFRVRAGEGSAVYPWRGRSSPLSRVAAQGRCGAQARPGCRRNLASGSLPAAAPGRALAATAAVLLCSRVPKPIPRKTWCSAAAWRPT